MINLGTLGMNARGNYGGSLDQLFRSAGRFLNSSREQLRLMSQAVRNAYDSGTLENALFTSQKAMSLSENAQAVFDGVYRATGGDGPVDELKALQPVSQPGFWAGVGAALTGGLQRAGQAISSLSVNLTAPTILFINPYLMQESQRYLHGGGDPTSL